MTLTMTRAQPTEAQVKERMVLEFLREFCADTDPEGPTISQVSEAFEWPRQTAYQALCRVWKKYPKEVRRDFGRARCFSILR